MPEVTEGFEPAVLARGARPMVLLRYRPGLAGETARAVHLVSLPIASAGAVNALCGALLPPDQVEAVNPGHGMPCTACFLSHVSIGGTPPRPTEDPPTASSRDDAVPSIRYQTWGWPVTLHRDQVRLRLGHDTLALIMPVLMAAQVTAILHQWRCPPPVLAHPYMPEHRLLLAGERYGMGLPWPPGLHQVTGSLLLPPTMTARGPITWVHPPTPDALQLCREIEILAAVRTALRDPTPAFGPVHS